MKHCPPRRAHFVGIGGSGMRALASVMAARGWQISGSDLDADALRELSALGGQLVQGHRAENVPSDCRLLIYSAAIAAENPERQMVKQLGIKSISYAEALRDITADHETLAIAGTHGKSSVTAMTAEILILAGLSPTVVCGAAPAMKHGGGLARTGGCHGHGKTAIVEACEYRGNFLHLRPRVATLLNIEADHFDCYPSMEQLKLAFTQFVRNVQIGGSVIVNDACPIAREVATASGRRIATFGFSHTADWRAVNLEYSRGRYRFDLVRHGQRLTHVSLAVPGRHNVLNALAAAALARHCGVSAEQISQGLALFRGLKRRLQFRGNWNNTAWIDDYAHHPTEVTASLAAVRQMFPRRRLVCVFQPHQASRLGALLDELAASLHNVDEVAVADVFCSREGVRLPGEATSADLASVLRSCAIDVMQEHDPKAIAQRLFYKLQPNDVLVTMGAGDLGKIFNKFQQRLRRNRAAA